MLGFSKQNTLLGKNNVGIGSIVIVSVLVLQLSLTPRNYTDNTGKM